MKFNLNSTPDSVFLVSCYGRRGTSRSRTTMRVEEEKKL